MRSSSPTIRVLRRSLAALGYVGMVGETGLTVVLVKWNADDRGENGD
jgi:hypothetical protein